MMPSLSPGEGGAAGVGRAGQSALGKWGRVLWEAPLTIWMAVPLQHEVDGIHSPGRGVVAEAQRRRLGTCHLEQLSEGPEDFSLGPSEAGSGSLHGSDVGTSPQSSLSTRGSLQPSQAPDP